MVVQSLILMTKPCDGGSKSDFDDFYMKLSFDLPKKSEIYPLDRQFLPYWFSLSF